MLFVHILTTLEPQKIIQILGRNLTIILLRTGNPYTLCNRSAYRKCGKHFQINLLNTCSKRFTNKLNRSIHMQACISIIYANIIILKI